MNGLQRSGVCQFKSILSCDYSNPIIMSSSPVRILSSIDGCWLLKVRVDIVRYWSPDVLTFNSGQVTYSIKVLYVPKYPLISVSWEISFRNSGVFVLGDRDTEISFVRALSFSERISSPVASWRRTHISFRDYSILRPASSFSASMFSNNNASTTVDLDRYHLSSDVVIAFTVFIAANCRISTAIGNHPVGWR